MAPMTSSSTSTRAGGDLDAGYLDHAANSPLRPEAKKALVDHLDLVGNASALHRAGQRARRALEDARESLAAALGAHPTSVVFTSGGSESNTIATRGSRRARPDRPGALVSAIEHPSVLGLRDEGAEVIPVTSSGSVTPEALGPLLGDHVAVASVMSVNNETGIIQPIAELAGLAATHGVWFHTDAVQALGHLPLHFDHSGIDLMTLSAHKVGGPVGIGALVTRRGIDPKPTGLGGGQERDIRSGTAMVALAASFAVAATLAVEDVEAQALRLGALQQRIVDLVVDNDGIVNTLSGPHTTHIVNATFPGLRASDLLFLLDGAGIDASVGSACRAGVHQPSEVMLAMGRSQDLAAATVRFSLGATSSEDDVDLLASVLGDSVQRARSAF